MKDNLFFDIEKVNKEDLNFTIGALNFKMVKVKGGTFTMGATEEQGEDAWYGEHDDERPTHKVTLSDYYIGQTVVTQELWELVMGFNPSIYKGNRRPVDNVNWLDCQEFIANMNMLFSGLLGGLKFTLPTEAQWEFAARGGKKSKNYKYAGSNIVDDVAWYDGNSHETHPVAQKQPNELGLYDMSGNVYEWCKDWYGDYSSHEQTNPKGPKEGAQRVIRGGVWVENSWFSRVSRRAGCLHTHGSCYMGFRLCLAHEDVEDKIENAKQADLSFDSLYEFKTIIPFTVNGITFNMIKVEGDTFTMGATDEQSNIAFHDEYPAHKVTLSDYYIGQTVVTQELWKAVMGVGEYLRRDDKFPVTDVNWHDCHAFICKLNILLSDQLLGKRFKLPTEAQWEFAARGGKCSNGYRYSGSNNIKDVAWREDDIIEKIHPVAWKKINELGIHEMTGNMLEWCNDWYDEHYFLKSRKINPTGPLSGDLRVLRGGSYYHLDKYCRVSSRHHLSPENKGDFISFRLCLE